MKIFVFGVCLLLLALTTQETRAATCPPGWGNPSGGGKCFKFMGGRGSWLETERACQQAGAKMKWPGGASLATIGSSSDQAAVMTAMNGVDPNKFTHVYIGGFNRFYGGKKNWSWIDGTPFNYFNFERNLLDSGNEDCWLLSTNHRTEMKREENGMTFRATLLNIFGHGFVV
eukprot:TRINITY_DN4640_c0_g1_i4.p1 TRINITY_DN4640_c0_g1~~TRINITY_DN4640_c0_g1_i4.p1  ORF type:complete len:172 (-),score=34.88 TRINITY_DN4640_c0_g1_i4:51-566(-)